MRQHNGTTHQPPLQREVFGAIAPRRWLTASPHSSSSATATTTTAAAAAAADAAATTATTTAAVTTAATVNKIRRWRAARPVAADGGEVLVLNGVHLVERVLHLGLQRRILGL